MVSTDNEELSDGKKVLSWVWSNFMMLQDEGSECIQCYCGESKSLIYSGVENIDQAQQYSAKGVLVLTKCSFSEMV